MHFLTVTLVASLPLLMWYKMVCRSSLNYVIRIWPNGHTLAKGMFYYDYFQGSLLSTNIMSVVVDSSVGRALSFSHEGPQFKSRHGHLFVSLLICDLIDCSTDEH
jgi:hypothetical protein